MGYAIPITQAGGRGMPVYAGERRQMGGNLFGTIKRIALPLLYKLLPVLKTLGKRAASSALSVGSGIAGDMIAGRFKEIPKNIRSRGKYEVNALSRDYLGQNVFQDLPEVEQTGSGRRGKTINRKRVKRLKKVPAIQKRRRLAIE
jgi:hypothetical protein